jgi:uncharacterized protein YbjT (DUF2867 family)
VSKHAAISPGEAADRLAIRELVEAYAYCADRRDAKGQMSLFTPDTHFVVYMDAKNPTPSQELHSREALAPVFADLNNSFLSGSGADPTGRSRIPFARYKGEAEKALLAAGFPRVCIFRHAYIYPVEPRKEPNFSYRLLRGIYPVFRVLFPNLVIRADDLARAMVEAAIRGTEEREGLVLENRDIRSMVALRV